MARDWVYTNPLSLHSRVAEELRARGVTRSSNNPTGDLAEYLFCKAFGWTQAQKSHANIDAVGKDGTRYQIKGRRVTRFNNSRQLSAEVILTSWRACCSTKTTVSCAQR